MCSHGQITVFMLEQYTMPLRFSFCFAHKSESKPFVLFSRNGSFCFRFSFLIFRKSFTTVTVCSHTLPCSRFVEFVSDYICEMFKTFFVPDTLQDHTHIHTYKHYMCLESSLTCHYLIIIVVFQIKAAGLMLMGSLLICNYLKLAIEGVAICPCTRFSIWLEKYHFKGNNAFWKIQCFVALCLKTQGLCALIVEETCFIANPSFSGPIIAKCWHA